jgi:ABC-type multidrug transport system ATPase subunit
VDPTEPPHLSGEHNPALSNAAIVLENVSKVFGRFVALREVTARFEYGRLYAIFGPNGAGKSTLLRVVCGLARPTSGTVTVIGHSDLREVAGKLGYMAHASLLYDEMSGIENLRYFAGLYEIRDQERLRQAIITVGLDPDLPRRVGEYSQGMRQRLSLARATLHDPDLLLLDEPFANLDPESSRAMSRLLGQMRDRGKTILLVTHQPAHVADIADESLWMTAGAIAAWNRGVAVADSPSRSGLACKVSAGGPRVRL